MKSFFKTIYCFIVNKKPAYPLFYSNNLLPALESSNIGLWEYDVKNEKLFYSQKAMEILGFEDVSSSFYKIDHNQLVHPEDLEHVKENFFLYINNKTSYYRCEHRQRCKLGNYIWVLDYGKIIERDKYGKTIRILGSFTEITERKQHEITLNENLNLLTTKNKILENFAGMASHNLKEYAGNFESLLGFYDETQCEKEKKELIENLKTLSNLYTKTISNLSEIVSIKNLKKLQKENLNVYAFLENAKILFTSNLVNKNIVVNNNVNPDIYIYSNRVYLESIVHNILSNAIKYSHPERSLIIDINSNMAEDGLLKITVTDNGIGMDLDKYGKDVFNLYKTFHGNENAEGLGLYITKNQVEALGGKIEVTRSEVNVGTTFTFIMNTKKIQP